MESSGSVQLWEGKGEDKVGRRLGFADVVVKGHPLTALIGNNRAVVKGEEPQLRQPQAATTTR